MATLSVEERLDRLEARLDFDSKIETLTAKVAENHAWAKVEFADVRGTQKLHSWMIGTVIALLFLLIAANGAVLYRAL